MRATDSAQPTPPPPAGRISAELATDAGFLRRSIESGETQHVLFVRPGRVGDLLFLTPVLRRFKERFPGVKLSVLASRYASAALRHNPIIEQVVSYDPRAPRWRRWLEHRRLVRDVAALRPQAAVVLSRRNRERRALGRAGIGHLFHFPDSLLDNSERGGHVVEQLMRAVAPLGVEGPPGPLEIYHDAEDTERARRFLRSAGIGESTPYAVLHPGCFQLHNHRLQTFSARRLWPLESFRALAQRLHDELGLQIVLSGAGKHETRMVERCAAQLTFSAARATDLDINELAALLRDAALLVTIDTGPMHVGAAMQTPLVALFGPSPVHYTRPWGTGPMKILRKDIWCSPCRGKGIQCLDNVCMKQITVDEVLEASRALTRSS